MLRKEGKTLFDNNSSELKKLYHEWTFRNKQNNLHTWTCGHAASSVGSSSSGSYSAPAGFDDGGSGRKMLIANYQLKQTPH